jgi:hypothetical protein
VARRRRQLRRGDPHRRLSIACALAHRHDCSVVRRLDRVDPQMRSVNRLSSSAC